MIKWFLVLCCVSAIVVASSACPENNVNPIDVGKKQLQPIRIHHETVTSTRVPLKPAFCVDLVFDSNPSTGYTWRHEFQPAHSWVSLHQCGVVPPNTALIGAPSLEMWTFCADGVDEVQHEATQVVEFVYERSWSNEVAAKHTVTFVLESE